MTNEITVDRKDLEHIHQLAIVGQAALHTNLEDPHTHIAVASLLEVIANLSANVADRP